MKDIKLSIIIPCYNVEKYIETGVSSILKLNDISFEIICVNDGSTDETLNLLNNNFSSEKRVKIINQVNKGAAIARREGFIEAKGEYVIFHDADNSFNEGVNFNSFLKGDDIYSLNYFSEGVKKPAKAKNFNDLYDKPAGIWTRVFKRNIIKTVDFVDYKMANDIPITFGSYKRAKSIVEVDDYFEILFVNKESITNKINLLKVKDVYKSVLSSGLSDRRLDYRVNYQLAGIISMMMRANEVIEKKEIKKFISSIYKKHKLKIKGNHFIKLRLLRFRLLRSILLWRK